MSYYNRIKISGAGGHNYGGKNLRWASQLIGSISGRFVIVFIITKKHLL